MPLMAAYEQNDARDAARQLAVRTLAGLRGAQHGPGLGNAINNMYRLLQGYRSHGFYGFVDHVHPEEEVSMTSLLTSSDRNVGDLREALDQTFHSVCGEQDPANVIDEMKLVLRMVAYPAEGDDVDPGERERLAKFFETLLQNLEA